MKNTIKIPLIFFALLIVGSSLIYFGSKNDAVSVAKNLKSGVLTADQINIAFENVGGKLIKHDVQESQIVKKGDVLMVLDDIDTNIAIERINAVIGAQQALINQEQSAIQIENNDIALSEITAWHKIEEIQAMLDAAIATEKLAKAEFERNAKLSKNGSVSQSAFDNVSNTLTRARMDVIQIRSQLDSTIVGATDEQKANLQTNKSAQGMTLASIINAKQKLDNRQNQLALLQAQLAQYQSELKQLQINLKRLTLVAPESGKILKILYEDGEMVPAGAPAIILETNRKYVDIYVNEQQVSAYQPGVSVSAKTPALDDLTLNGVVRFASAASSFADLRMSREHGQADLTSFQVRIYMQENSKLLTGMTIEVDDEQHY